MVYIRFLFCYNMIYSMRYLLCRIIEYTSCKKLYSIVRRGDCLASSCSRGTYQQLRQAASDTCVHESRIIFVRLWHDIPSASADQANLSNLTRGALFSAPAAPTCRNKGGFWSLSGFGGPCLAAITSEVHLAHASCRELILRFARF